MRPPGLRAQWVLASIAVPLLALAAAGAFALQARGHGLLEAAFQRELGFLVQLPRLREDVRLLEQVTGKYLSSGDRLLLRERKRILAELRRLEAGLVLNSEGQDEKDLLDRLGREVAGLLSEQEGWIARRSQGRLAQGLRPKAGEDPVGAVVRVLTELKDAKRARLDERRRRVERQGRAALWLLVAAGAAFGLATSAALSRFLVGPLLRLRDYSASWRLEQPWTLRLETASREVAELGGRLEEMAGRLRTQFDKEQELGRMKTQLVAMVSHEFNNSLSVLGGMSRLLRDDDPRPDDERRTNFYNIIDAQVRSLTVATRTLLELGRLEAGQLRVKTVRMDLAALARDCRDRMEVLWSRKSHQVALECGRPVWVRGDPDALALVITNLLANAVKYTPEKGTIRLSAAPGPEGVEFSVTDSGIGIAPEDQERILSGYFRTEEGKKAAKGFGVGLALSQALLAAHGSALKVESTLGQGARFSFVLPAADGSPPAG